MLSWLFIPLDLPPAETPAPVRSHSPTSHLYISRQLTQITYWCSKQGLAPVTSNIPNLSVLPDSEFSEQKFFLDLIKHFHLSALPLSEFSNQSFWISEGQHLWPTVAHENWVLRCTPRAPEFSRSNLASETTPKSNPVGVHLPKVNNRNTRTKCEMFQVNSKDTRTMSFLLLTQNIWI